MRAVLFEKTAIAGMELKNRIIMAPMGNLADTDGGFSQRQIDYYEERAKGGAGLIVSGSLAFTSLLGSPYSGIFENVRHVGRAAELADAVHRYGAKLAFQFNMGGGRCGGNISASEVPTLANPDVLCRALTVEEIHKVVAAMGTSAALAKGAGVDAIVIHAYAGYLLDQFQSSEWNHREDEYGGSLENRMRLTKELIQAVKKTCGKNYPVIVKFSVEHHTETGRKLDEGLQMCRMLEEYGADAIIADAGSFATRWNRCVPTVYEPHAFSLYAAKAVKDTVRIPVIGQNKLFVPDTAAAAVADGSCDLIALGHALLADPEWPVKAKEGRDDEIRYCIGCNNCLLSVNTAKYFRCSVNPWLMHEKDAGYRIRKADRPKRVLVIGGGPAGMMAANVAAEAGHDTELWEKADTLGGTVRAAGGPDFKQDLMRFTGYLENGLRRNQVRVCTGKTADAESVKAGGFDQVILAAGAVPKLPELPGIHGPKVISSTDYLAGKEVLAGNIVVLGGGLAGCESAIQAAKTADVTILEYLDGILMTGVEARNNGLSIRNRLVEDGVKIVTGAAVREITDGEVLYIHEGQERRIPYDCMITATGFVSCNTLAEELGGAGIPVTVIGDAKKPGKIRTGICEALFAVLDM